MDQRRKVDTARYHAIGKTGDEYVIIETTEQIRFNGLDGVSDWKNGGRSYRTNKGKPVNWIKDGVFEIVHSGDVATVTDS